MIAVALVVTLTAAWIPPRASAPIRAVPEFDLAVIDEVERNRLLLHRDRPFGCTNNVRRDFSQEIAQSVDEVR